MQIEVVVPDGVSGPWKVETFTISKQESESSLLRSLLTGTPGVYVQAGTYKRLMCSDEVVMSNTLMEINTNKDFINRATGRVLINGLGLGMVLSEILKKDSVESVTVIERFQDVINLTAPSFAHDPRVKIIHCCAFEYTPEDGEVFDVAWHDIWTYISPSNLDEMWKLEDKLRPYVKGYQESWAKSECMRMARVERAARIILR